MEVVCSQLFLVDTIVLSFKKILSECAAQLSVDRVLQAWRTYHFFGPTLGLAMGLALCARSKLHSWGKRRPCAVAKRVFESCTLYVFKIKAKCCSCIVFRFSKSFQSRARPRVKRTHRAARCAHSVAHRTTK